MTWRGTTTVGDRLLACLPYLLTLVYAYPFSLALSRQFPILEVILLPFVLPGFLIYSAIPLAPRLVVFMLLFIFVVRNEKILHFIRFNTMQALLISTVLLLCSILLLDFPAQSGFSLGFIGLALGNGIFIATLVAFIYSVVQTLRGRYAELPAISEAVYLQVR